MDHVPQAQSSPHSPIKVPYFVTNKFKNVIFNHDDITTEWNSISPHNRRLIVFLQNGSTTQVLSTVQDILDFYQAQCFFGLLCDVYTAAGKKFDTEIYLDRQDGKQAFVTTASLVKELEILAYEESGLSDEARSQKYLQVDRYVQATEDLTMYLQMSVVEDSKYRKKWEEDKNTILLNDFWLMQITTESAAMLRETIISAIRQIYMPTNVSSELASRIGRELPPAPENLFCMERFKAAGWCIRHALELAQSTLKSRSVLFALSSIDRRNANQNHSSCKEESCLYDEVDNDTYQTQHAPDCNTKCGPFVSMESAGNESRTSAVISRCVMNGAVPLISLVERANHKPVLEVHVYQLAESDHVLKRKRRASESLLEQTDPPEATANFTPTFEDATDEDIDPILQDIESHRIDQQQNYVAISHVWSQGLGNRRQNALPLCQLRRLQHFANNLVPSKKRPVPFWIDTICVPLSPGPREMAIKAMRTVYRDAVAVLVVDSTLTELQGSRTNQELLMRIKAAPWAQRLWTYQEACLAQNLYFQVGAGLDREAMWSQDLIMSDESRRKIDSSNAATSADKLDHLSPESMSSHSATNINLLEYTSAYLLTEAASLQLFGPSNSPFISDLRYLSRQLALRTTSRSQDEAICLSTLIGLSPADVLLSADGISTVPEFDRMKRLWEVLPAAQIPGEILFCNRPFYSESGCGWMARSLLRNSKGNQLEHLGCGMVLNKDASWGILVKMAGIVFDVPDMSNGAEWLNITVLNAGDCKYRLSVVEASESVPFSRLSAVPRTFAVLMPESELDALIEGDGSDTTECPFGLLVNVLERPARVGGGEDEVEPDEEEEDDENDSASVLFVTRREMVEFQLVSENETEDEDEDEADKDADTDANETRSEAYTDADTSTRASTPATTAAEQEDVMLDMKILGEDQKWYVG